ncbi:MFS transporter [soil metagenome]
MSLFWRVITPLGITQIIGWGTTYYALGALSLDIAADTGWPKTLIFGAFSAALLISGMISRRAGRAIDKHGGKRVMAAGSILAAIGCLILYFATAAWIYIAGWLVLGPAMRLILYDAAFPALAQVAGDGSRRAISYLTLFGGLASTAFWPLSHFLSTGIGWHAAFLVYAGLHLFICLPIHLIVLTDGRPAPRDLPPAGVITAGTPPLLGRDRRRAMIAFAAVLALNGIVFSSISAHIVPLFQSLGFTPALAVTLAALVGPCQVASRIGDILAGHHIKTVSLGIVAVGLLPLALLIFALGEFSFTAALIFAVLYGMSNGLMSIIKGVIPLSLFGRDGFGLVLGTIITPQLIMNALAPTLFAFALDLYGPRVSLYLAIIAAGLSLGVMLWLARRYPR